MTEIKDILNKASHRPWKLPIGQWEYYQEWNNALFLHWEIPYESLRKLVPKRLNLDNFEGKYYISLVAFTMQKIRPRKLPSQKFISDFHEINIRTYIDNDGKKGVYFINIEAQKSLSAFLARKLSGLPYEKSNITRVDNNYTSNNPKKKFKLEATFNVINDQYDRTELDKWLIERYCLYLDKNNLTFRYDIHHKEWEIKNVQIDQLDIDYKIGNIELTTDKPFLAHYSKGVKVVSWTKKQVN